MSKRRCVLAGYIPIFVYCIINKKRYLDSLSANDEYTCHPKSTKVTSMFRKSMKFATKCFN